MEIYDGFSNWEDVQRDYEMDDSEPDQVILASYQSGGYEGSSMVIFRNGETYFMNNASHCSCHGLEGQWIPEEFESKDLFVKYLESLKPHEFESEIKTIISQLKGQENGTQLT